jgi:tetratricopeptide (TPR) repeat protein
MLGAAIVVAALLDRWPRAGIVIAVASAVMMVLSIRQSRTWVNSMSLFEQALWANPYNATSHSNMGNALAAAGNINAAMDHFQSAVALDPRNHLARTSLAQAELQVGHYEQAVEQARIAVELTLPGEEPGKEHLIAGLALMKLNRFAEAADEFRQTLRTEPGNALAQSQLQITEERLSATRPSSG